MNKCKCGRPIENGEKNCPNCASKKNRGWKLAGEIILGIIGAAFLGGAGYKKFKNK